MRLVRWGLVVGMVPVVFATTMVVPEQVGVLGMGPALGCSAGGNVPTPPDGFTWLSPALLGPGDERDAVPVGTDGFFVMIVGTNGLDAEATQSALSVDVRNAGGEVVNGRTQLLKEESPGSYLFGWEAEEPLELEAELMVTLSAEPWVDERDDVYGEFPLVVAGEPVALPAPELTFSNWVGFFRGAGPNVTCAIDPSHDSCSGADMLDVPGSFEELQAAHVTWQLPRVSVGVAWEARLEASSRDSDAELSEYSAHFFADAPDPVVSLSLAKFPTSAEEHCVTLAIRDLRRDVSDSAEFCFATEAPTRYESDSELRACLEPPSDATAEAWCRLRAEPPPECEAILEGSEPTEPPSDAASRSRTSKGCQLASLPSGGVSAWPVLAALVALRRRRQR